MKKLSFFLLTSVIVIACLMSCQPSDDPNVNAKHEQIMEIHDRVMPEMSTTRKLRKTLKTYPTSPQVESMITALENADEAMMDWMAGYKIPKDVSSEQQLKYLAGEEIKAKQMEELFDNAINTANAYIAQNPL